MNSVVIRLLHTIGFLVICICLSGCHPTGRVDVTHTTDAEKRSDKVLPVALTEFSDQVARRLVHDLVRLPLIADSPERVTVVMGDINNQTGNVSSSEFELVRSRIRSQLLQDLMIRERMRFVAGHDRLTRLRERERVATAGSDPQRDPDLTFVLNSDVYRISRAQVQQYYMEVQLVHSATHEIVFSNRYDVKQVAAP